MPKNEHKHVKDLKLDLSNFRTVKQASEAEALQAMVSISPDRFWALTESLIDDGYLPTENILVLNAGPKGNIPTVKEGNRRVAALKLIHGILKTDGLAVPEAVLTRLNAVPAQWKADNATVPCTIYPLADAAKVDRIVTLAHGKGEKAGRDQWNAVARARHNRDYNRAVEPALDVLESYLATGLNLLGQQRERWAGDYPISVLDEAMRRIALRLGATSAPELAKKYPAVPHRDAFENILRDIGLKNLGFDSIRKVGTDFAATYGIPPATTGGLSTGPVTGSGTGAGTGVGSRRSAGAEKSGAGTGTESGTGSRAGKGAGSGPAAFAINDHRAVTKTLKQFVPKGGNRQKIVTLRDEALNLTLRDNPIAFCFLLRSMFEISAKLYADDHSISLKKADGQDKSLAGLLKECKDHVVGGSSSSPGAKLLHGAQTELARKDGILSVTSMNQLVHHPTFSVQPPDISTLFHNIFPLLEALNK